MSTILIVEDEPAIRDMLARRLTFEGFKAISAGDGRRGVEMARAEQPDLILMDMGLPVLTGWQATEAIKASADTQRIPVIALTAYAQLEDRQKCFAAGCSDYETKPIEFPKLLAKIRHLLQPPVASPPSAQPQ